METSLIILCFGYIFFAVSTASTFRFGVALRSYIFASLLLAGTIFLIGREESSKHILELGALTLLFKVIFIPLMMRFLITGDRYPKLASRLKPTFTRMISILMIGIVGVAVVLVGGEHFLNDKLFVTIAGFSALGIAAFSLLLAKSTYGQLFGLLMIENAFSLLILGLDINFHLSIELGLLMTALFAWLIMHILSDNIRDLFGEESVSRLNELSE